MTFGELQTEVFRRLNESAASPVFWTAEDVKTVLNEGYEEMSDASEWYERNANLALLSKRTYYDLRSALGTDVILTVKHAYNSTTRRWLSPGDLRELDDRTFVQWEEITGQPEQFFLRGLFWLGTFPKQTADQGTLKVYYTALPPILSASDDVPGFPEEYHYGLVEYALGELLSQDQETQKALGHFAAYLEQEAALMQWVNGRTALDRINRLNG